MEKILKLSFWIILLVHQGSNAQRTISPELQSRIESYMTEYFLPANRNTGLIFTIAQDDGQLLYTNGFGSADIEKGILNTNSTEFPIASVTKSFTSLLVVKLLHENFPELGESALDTPIRRLLPQANFSLIDRFRTEHVNFRDLLAHRVCLGRDDLQMSSDPGFTAEEVAYRTRYNFEICGIRTEYQYNNQLYVIASELAGLIANKPYEDAMGDLLNELGMRDTSFLKKSDNFTQLPRAQPYYFLDDFVYPYNEELVKRTVSNNGAMGLVTTANDMSRYLRFQINGGELDGIQIVPKDVMEWLYKPSLFHPDNAFKENDEDSVINQVSIGLGIETASYDGWRLIHKDGHIPPYQSMMSYMPAKKLAIFSSANMAPLRIPQPIMHADIFEIVKGTGESEMRIRRERLLDEWKAKEDKKRAEGMKKIENKLKQKTSKVEIVGKYGSGSSGDLEVTERFIEETNQTEYYLEHGVWFRGWLYNCEGCAENVFKINFDTDLIQDNYIMGVDEIPYFIVFGEGEVSFEHPWEYFHARFKLGLRMGDLPEIPWEEGSC